MGHKPVSFMKRFDISRINTELGIYRFSGGWCDNKFEVDSIEVMGTDGWVSLDITNQKVIKIVKELEPVLLDHLVAKDL